MKKRQTLFSAIGIIILSLGCATSYKAKPLPFKHPSTYPNAIQVAGATNMKGLNLSDKEENQA